jgi:hypothetical protein
MSGPYCGGDQDLAAHQHARRAQQRGAANDDS